MRRPVVIFFAVAGIATVAVAQRKYESDGSATDVRGTYTQLPNGSYEVVGCAKSKGTDGGHFPPLRECVSVNCPNLFAAACGISLLTAWRAANTDP